MSNNSSAAERSISLPKGGGALKGIGETFKPNLFSGTGSHSIPIAISTGRNGFSPSLNLEYSSGNGNGLFGFGWDVSIPRITRKTEKGIPKYNDEDVFVMSGAEDLVPYLVKNVDPSTEKITWTPSEPIAHQGHTIYRYRPRTEGLFARIERWVHTTTGVTHWRIITKDNITNLYGSSSASRISDPADERRVFEWLLQETHDSLGNRIVYEYAKDNPDLYRADAPHGLSESFERNRDASRLYIRRICYGNLPDPLIDEQGNAITYADGAAVGLLCDGRRYAFEVVFDYGDWDVPTKALHPPPSQQQELFDLVAVREDRFSSFRAGFEIRTLRRCRRVLMFHHFAELGGPTLVRSTDLAFRTDPDTRLSLLTSVAVTSYEKDAASAYRSASLPPVTFGYTEFKPLEQRYQSVMARGNDMPARALDDPNIALVDLFGDGLPDLVHTGSSGFRYWKNLGAGLLDRPRTLNGVPPTAAFERRGVSFGDMEGDGRSDLLVHSSPLRGFYETTSDEAWRTFRPYEVVPSFDVDDPNVRLVDLTGDGRSDALMTQAEHFLWFECLGEKGFAPAKYIPRVHDSEQFPDVFFNDPAGRVRLADMTGDGLQDIVLVYDGRIDYWPNIGYGRFGKRMTMENTPRIGVGFDPKRLFLADLNGTGCVDLVYVDFDRVHFWFNQSGNRWSEKQTILGTPIAVDANALHFADVFGTGTATLVWSYDFSLQPEGNYKALDFCGGVKPYVLTETSNNMGATTRVSYAPSTRYYLEDRANGTPWITKLPFPVQVVDKVEVIDHIGKTKLVTTYKYHHGYFDGREREFRGFGRVDQFDTETFEDFVGSGLHDAATAFINTASAFHVPPVETRSWFHTGIYFDADSAADIAETNGHVTDYVELTQQFQREFYSLDTAATPLSEHEIDIGEAPHEAYRALRGAVLRTEIYARDGSAKAEHPYQVTESRYRVVHVQPQGGNHHGVYFSHALESLNYHYERDQADPRVSHALTLEMNGFGNTLRSLSVAYGRRQSDLELPKQEDKDKQTSTFVTYTESRYTNAIDDALNGAESYRTPLPCETRTYELTGFRPEIPGARFRVVDWTAGGFVRIDHAETIAYEAAADPTREQKRLIEHVRTCYRPDDLGSSHNDPLALLPLGVVESLALGGETYKLAFTPALLQQTYQRAGTDLLGANPSALLAGGGGNHGGYVDLDNDQHWWIPSGRVFLSPDGNDDAAAELVYARRHFFKSCRQRNPFYTDQWKAESFVHYDNYDLVTSKTVDAVGNTVIAAHDYRVLQPHTVTDPNGNRARAAFDTLGLVIASAIMGKSVPEPQEGDLLEGFDPNPPLADLQAFVADPFAHAANLLGNATTRVVYDFDRFRRCGQPPLTATLARETHVADLDGAASKIQIDISYSDGFGREIQKKVQAEPGDAPQRNAVQIAVSGDVVPGLLVLNGGRPVNVSAQPRWVGNGRTVFNNKGKPVRQYEPFFSSTHLYEPEQELTDIGVSPVLFYDPLGRVIATLYPNQTYGKAVFDPWRQMSFDVNDTVAPNGSITGDPGTDPDIAGYVAAYLATQTPTWKSWYQRRIDGDFGLHEKNAATRAAIHANTPVVAHSDSMGRVFLAIAHNRFKFSDAPLADSPQDEFHATRVHYDIEGNQRQVADANDRIVMRYGYDMLGNRIYQASMEAGERWMLNDVSGKPLRGWNSRRYEFSSEYDLLRRPVKSFVQGGDPAEPDASVYPNPILFERTLYGDSSDTGLAQSEQRQANLRGKLFKHLDTAGASTTNLYDFKGNPLESVRELAREYENVVDWNQPQPPGETFAGRMSYDALNRPIGVVTPDNSVYRPNFNEANLLNRLDVNLQGRRDVNDDPIWTSFVANIDYDAKGQRTRIDYGNDASTAYEYDSETFRLARLLTQHGNTPLQDLGYTYDPIGNIARIRDATQQTIFFRNRRVEPGNEYLYDSVYRLIEATGREHLGQVGGPPIQHSYNDASRVGIAQPGDGNAMGRYLEQYHYDPVGNFLRFIHRGTDPTNPGWTREYAYQERSLLEAGKVSNRLTSTTIGTTDEVYSDFNGGYNAHGSMLRMPHLQSTRWNFKDELRLSRRQAVNQDDVDGNAHQGERTFYVYDSSGQRVRKVTERQNGTCKKERIYLGGFEIYREYDGQGNAITLERQTLHVVDDKQRIALVETKTVDTSGDHSPPQLIRYQLGNHLGSACLELDDRGTLISYEEYTPYGSTSHQQADSATNAAAKRYRYTGMERDEESGLNYHKARYYATWLGRWTATDPAYLSDGDNLYAYVRGNPNQFVDKAGTDSRRPTDAELKQMEERIQAHRNVWFQGLADPTVSNMILTDSEAAAINNRVEAMLKLSDGYQATGNHADASILGHLAMDLKFRINVSNRWSELEPIRAQVERIEGKSWLTLSDSAKSYWRMKLGHPEWQIKENVITAMTGSILEESQSTDVQIFHTAIVGVIFGAAMSRPRPRTTSGEFNVKELANPKLKDEPSVIDSDADYSGLATRHQNKLRDVGARRTDNFVTFDNPIGATRGQQGKIMKAVNAWLGLDKRGSGTWQSGTHGEPDGTYGTPKQLDPDFIPSDAAEAAINRTNWNVERFTNPLPQVYGPGKICVLSWCYSTASLMKQRP